MKVKRKSTALPKAGCVSMPYSSEGKREVACKMLMAASSAENDCFN